MGATRKIVLALAIVVVVGIGGLLAWNWQSSDDLASLLSASEKVTEEQVAMVIERISRFMVLPTDQQPSVVVIKDSAELADQQSFYRGSSDGDILVLYPDRAIIYDPKADKLVNVGPIVQNTAVPSVDPAASTTPAEPEKVTVDVRNGTATAGLAGATASELKKNNWVVVGKVGDATNQYTKTVIVDLSGGKKPNAMAKLKELLDADIATELSKGEASSTADIVVIIGR